MTQLMMAAFVMAAADQGALSPTSGYGAPMSEPCPKTFSIGHVPGHMDAVWELSC
jgi:hypothetical protein